MAYLRPRGLFLLGLVFTATLFVARGEETIAAEQQEKQGATECQKVVLGPANIVNALRGGVVGGGDGASNTSATSCILADVALPYANGGVSMQIRGARVNVPCEAGTRVDGELVLSPEGLPFPLSIGVDIALPCAGVKSEATTAIDDDANATDGDAKLGDDSPAATLKMRTRGVTGAAGIAIPPEAFKFGPDSVPPVDVTATWNENAKSWSWSGAVAAKFGPTEEFPFMVKLGVDMGFDGGEGDGGANATTTKDGSARADVVRAEISYKSEDERGMAFTLAGRATLGAAYSKNVQECGAALSGELLLSVDPTSGINGGTVDALAEGTGDIPPPTSFKVNATGSCEDASNNVTTMTIVADASGWRIVDDVLTVEKGDLRLVVTRRRGQSGIGNITGSVRATVRLGSDGRGGGMGADGIPPIFDASLELASDFSLDSSNGGKVDVRKFALSGDVKIVKGSPLDDSKPFVAIVGKADMSFPCLSGDDIVASVSLTARAGNLNVDKLKADLVYHCGGEAGVLQDTSVSTLPLAGTQVPVFEIQASAGEGGVTFVKGLTLNDFGLNLTASRSWDGYDARINSNASETLSTLNALPDSSVDARLFANISAQDTVPKEGMLGEDGKSGDNNVTTSVAAKNTVYKTDPGVKYGLPIIDEEDVNATNSGVRRADTVKWKWDFAGSVRGRLSVGDNIGAAVAFAMDTTDDSWKAAAKFQYVSDNLNATLAASGSSGSTLSCDDPSEENKSGDRTAMRLRTTKDAEGPEPVAVTGDVSFRFGGDGTSLIGRAEGQQLCGADHEWHIEAEVEEATIPIGDVATAKLENLVVVLDGYKKNVDKKPSERFEVYSALPQEMAAAMLGVVGNATSNSTSTDAEEEEEEEKRLDWTVHVEGGGSIAFGGSDEEDDFMNENVGYVNVTLDAHTDEQGDVVVDKVAVHGEFIYASDDDSIKVSGEMDIRLPCGAFPGPTFEGDASVDVVIGPLDVSGIEASVEYYCAPTEDDKREMHVWARMDSMKIGGDVGVTLSDVEIDVKGIALPVPPPPAQPEDDEISPAPQPAAIPANDSSPSPSPAPARAPASAPVVPAPAPQLAPSSVNTSDCCNGLSTGSNLAVGRQVKAGECCNPKTLRVVSGQEQCMSSRWCKSAGGISCTVSAKIPATKTCLDAAAPAAAAAATAAARARARARGGRSLLQDDDNNATTTLSRNWTFSGFVKGRLTVDAGGPGAGTHTLEAMYVFDTADGSWEAGVAYSLRMDGVELALAGRAASPCVKDRPTVLEGSLDLQLDVVQATAEVTALHWCEPNATVRMEVNASIPRLSILGGSLELVDVAVSWRALTGPEGSKAGTPLAKLRQEGLVSGTVTTDFGVNSPGVKLQLEASVGIKILYVPGGEAGNGKKTVGSNATAETGVRALDPVVDINAFISVAGVMEEGQPPMLEARIVGRFAPDRDEPLAAAGNATIRFPGPDAEDPPVELNVKLSARLWGSNIEQSKRASRVLEVSASLTGGVEGEAPTSVYGFTITKLSAIGVFTSPPSGLSKMRVEKEDEEISGELDGEAATGEKDVDLLPAAIPDGQTIGGEAAVNVTSDGEDATPSKAMFPALAFDLKDTRGEVKVYADVALDAAELADAIGKLPEGLDASARIVWKATLARAAGVDQKWKMAESEITVAASISYTSSQIEIDLRGEATTSCDKEKKDAEAWKLVGSLRVPALDLELLAAGRYRCASRELEAEINVTEVAIDLGPDFQLTAKDVRVRLDATILRFPGEDDASKNETDADSVAAFLGAGAAAATQAATSGETEADMDWIVAASGEISLTKGDAGMPNIDCRAVITVMLSNLDQFSNGSSTLPTDFSPAAVAEAKRDEAVIDDAEAAEIAKKNAADDKQERDWSFREVSVDLFFDYVMDGIEVSAEASFEYPCDDVVSGSAAVVFDEERTGIAVGAIQASVNVSCAVGTNSTAIPFVSFEGSIAELRITDEITIDEIVLTIVGRYVADGGKNWLITLSARSGVVVPTYMASPPPAPLEDVLDVVEPPGSLAWEAGVVLSVKTPSPLLVEKFGPEKASTSFNLTANVRLAYVGPAVTVDARGSLRLGACDVVSGAPRMSLDGNISINLPTGADPLRLFAKLVVSCVDKSDAAGSIVVGDGGKGPMEDLSQAEGNKPKVQIKYTVVNVTAGLAEKFDVVPDLLRVSALEANATIQIPADEYGEEVPTKVDGFVKGAASIVGSLPNVEAIDLDGTSVKFNVSFTTDDNGDIKLKKFYLDLDVEIKYW